MWEKKLFAVGKYCHVILLVPFMMNHCKWCGHEHHTPFEIRMQPSVRFCMTKPKIVCQSLNLARIPNVAFKKTEKATRRPHECNYTHFAHWLFVPISFRLFFFCIRNDLQKYWNYIAHAAKCVRSQHADTEEGDKNDKKKRRKIHAFDRHVCKRVQNARK